MSLKTWKAEFYEPISAVLASRAISHSLTKWRGLTPENLARHGLMKGDYAVIHERGNEDVDFQVDGTTCALCRLYYDDFDEEVIFNCEDCPIVTLTGHNCGVEYAAFSEESDPDPMLALLKKIHEEYGDGLSD